MRLPGRVVEAVGKDCSVVVLVGQVIVKISPFPGLNGSDEVPYNIKDQP